MQTDVFGPMQVSMDNDRVREGQIQGVGGHPGIGSASGYAYQHDNSHQIVHFAKKPAMEALTASGTIERQRGVYFKMRQSTQLTLEGSRQFRIVFEVPDGWRADLLDVVIEAVGTEAGHRRQRVLATQPFVVATYQDFDEYAGRAAANYIKQQVALSQTARSFARTIEQRTFPTPLHRLGAKLDMYEPELPAHWFENLVYQAGSGYHISKLSLLPVDVRVAVMNYVDQKNLIESLSATKRPIIVAHQIQEMARR
jgi:hypothetical protein